MHGIKLCSLNSTNGNFLTCFYGKVTDIGEIKRIYFFLSVNGRATSNVVSNASGKM